MMLVHARSIEAALELAGRLLHGDPAVRSAAREEVRALDARRRGAQESDSFQTVRLRSPTVPRPSQPKLL